jgi:hypothetical protein
MKTALELENLLTEYDYDNLNLTEAATAVYGHLVDCKADNMTLLDFIQNCQTIKSQINGNSALAELESRLETFNFAVDGLIAVAQEDL